MASHKYSSLIRLATSPLTVCIVAYLLISSFIYNYAFNTSDEGFFVYNAKLISLGKIPYRDFFVTTTPGIYYVQGLLMKLFGPYIVIDRLLQLAFVILL